MYKEKKLRKELPGKANSGSLSLAFLNKTEIVNGR